MKEIKYIISYLVPVPEPQLITVPVSDFLTSYGSGSTSHQVTVPTVPDPQRCLEVAEAHAPLEDVVLDGVRLDAVLSAVPQDPDQVVDEDSRGARSREDLLRAADLQGGIVKHLLKRQT
jgi:hypothetical protein